MTVNPERPATGLESTMITSNDSKIDERDFAIIDLDVTF